MAHATKTVLAKGTTLQLSIGGVFTTVAQMVDIDGPEMSVGTVSTVNLNSVAQTKRPTLPDGGTVSGTLQYDPEDPTHTALFNLIWASDVESWKLNYPDGPQSTHAFDGILTKLKPTGMENEELLEAEFEITVTGVVVMTAANPST